MKRFTLFVKIVFFILLILLVIFSPRTYSYQFCLFLLIAYIFENLLYFSFFREELVSFKSLFCLSFFFCNFIYPIFYYQENPDIALFRFDFDESIISYATAVAFCAYNCYLLGVMSVDNKKKVKIKKDRNVSLVFVRKIFYLILILFCCYTFSGGFNYIEDAYENDNFGSTPFYIKVITTFLRYLMLIFLLYVFKIYKDKHILLKKHVYLILAICVLFLCAGNRGMPLGVILVVLIFFNDYIRRIKFVELLLVGAIGVISLSFISYFRFDSSISLYDFGDLLESPFDVFLDLIINNRNLYTLVSYAEHNGYTYFSTQLGLLSFIPFAQSFVIELFDLDLYNTTSAAFSSYLTFGNVSGELGMGTNMVSDIYLSFGLIGTIVVFYLFGVFLQYCKLNSNTNIYCLIAYCVMVSDSVFICRGSVFGSVKLMIWFSLFERFRRMKEYK